LSSDQIQTLESLPGWTNDVLQATYEQGVSELKALAAKNGSCIVANDYVSPSGFLLGQWSSVKRMQFKKGKLADSRIAELEAIPGWTWDKNDAQWQQGYESLLKWVKVNGSAHVPVASVVEGFKLGWWARSQRDAKRAGWASMTQARRKALEALPGWAWDPPSASGKTGGRKASKRGQ
jgi:hypothetical protein